MIISPLKATSKSFIKLCIGLVSMSKSYIWDPLNQATPYIAKPLKIIIAPFKYGIDGTLTLFLSDYMLYRGKQIFKWISGSDESPTFHELISKTNLKTDNANEGVVFKFLISMVPTFVTETTGKLATALAPLTPESITSLKQVMTLGHHNTDGTFNWDVFFAMYEAVLFQRIGIIITSKMCFTTIGHGESRVEAFSLLGKVITTDRAKISGLYVGSKLTFGLLDYHMFNMYSAQIFFNQASENIEHQILQIQDQATTGEVTHLIDVTNNRLLNFSIQKGNCLKELTRGFVQIIDALAQQGSVTVAANLISFGILYLKQSQISYYFDEGKKNTIKASQLHHKLADGTYNVSEIIVLNKEIRTDILESDFWMKAHFLSITFVDISISILFREREIFRISSILLPNYNAVEEKAQNERSYDEATKVTSFGTANYLRLTEVNVATHIIVERILQKIAEIGKRTPEEVSALRDQERQVVAKKSMESIRAQFESLPEEMKAALLEMISPSSPKPDNKNDLDQQQLPENPICTIGEDSDLTCHLLPDGA